MIRILIALLLAGQYVPVTKSVSGIQTAPLFGKAITFAAGRMITAGLSFNF